MKKIYSIILLCAPGTAFSMGEVDPVIAKVMLDTFEVREADGENPFVWDASLYMGTDFNKLWIKSEGERVNNNTESSQIDFLYSHAVSPYWDIISGIRHDIQPDVDRGWLQLGFYGVAPYFVESEISLYVGENGRSALSLEFEKEFMLNQKWVLSPELEMNLYGHNDEAIGVGSGLSVVEFSIRLRYEVKREFAPYVGINWEKAYGNTADMARDEGHDASDTQFVFGVKAWY